MDPNYFLFWIKENTVNLFKCTNVRRYEIILKIKELERG
jgi:hypothetical protein